MTRRIKTLYIIFGIGILLIYGALAFFFIRGEGAIPLLGTPEQPVASPTPGALTIEEYQLIGTDVDTMVRSIEKKKLFKLPGNNEAVKEKLIQQASSTATLISSPSFSFAYDKEVHVFQLELKGQDNKKSEVAAISWMRQQGFTTDGICSLAMVVFKKPYQLSKRDLEFFRLSICSK